ncbi:MAG: hypothetical protein ABNH38_06095 [Tateyamaria sp.]
MSNLKTPSWMTVNFSLLTVGWLRVVSGRFGRKTVIGAARSERPL